MRLHHFKSNSNAKAVYIPILNPSTNASVKNYLVSFVTLDTKKRFTVVLQTEGSTTTNSKGEDLLTGSVRFYTTIGKLAGGFTIDSNIITSLPTDPGVVETENFTDCVVRVVNECFNVQNPGCALVCGVNLLECMTGIIVGCAINSVL